VLEPEPEPPINRFHCNAQIVRSIPLPIARVKVSAAQEGEKISIGDLEDAQSSPYEDSESNETHSRYVWRLSKRFVDSG